MRLSWNTHLRRVIISCQWLFELHYKWKHYNSIYIPFFRSFALSKLHPRSNFIAHFHLPNCYSLYFSGKWLTALITKSLDRFQLRPNLFQHVSVSLKNPWKRRLKLTRKFNSCFGFLLIFTQKRSNVNFLAFMDKFNKFFKKERKNRFFQNSLPEIF